jgi:hypothetical protein
MSTEQTQQNDGKTVITPEGILSYPFLATPQQERDDDGKIKPGGKLTYSTAIIFPASVDLSALKAAALKAATERWGDKAVQMIKDGALKWPFRKDGASKGYDKFAGEGCIFFNARSQRKPQCVYRHAAAGSTKPERIPDDKISEELYPGVKARLMIRAYTFENKSKGVTWSLMNVQKMGDGERLDNHVDAQDAFTADLSAAPASAAELDSVL